MDLNHDNNMIITADYKINKNRTDLYDSEISESNSNGEHTHKQKKK